MGWPSLAALQGKSKQKSDDSLIVYAKPHKKGYVRLLLVVIVLAFQYIIEYVLLNMSKRSKRSKIHLAILKSQSTVFFNLEKRGYVKKR